MACNTSNFHHSIPTDNLDIRSVLLSHTLLDSCPICRCPGTVLNAAAPTIAKRAMKAPGVKGHGDLKGNRGGLPLLSLAGSYARLRLRVAGQWIQADNMLLLSMKMPGADLADSATQDVREGACPAVFSPQELRPRRIVPTAADPRGPRKSSLGRAAGSSM